MGWVITAKAPNKARVFLEYYSPPSVTENPLESYIYYKKELAMKVLKLLDIELDNLAEREDEDELADILHGYVNYEDYKVKAIVLNTSVTYKLS